MGMRKKDDVFEHEMAVVAILKNEGDYVREWLDYYIAAGVTKFYLYDNESTDNLEQILQPYIEREIVEYNFIPGKKKQIWAYNNALIKHRFDCRFMAFIDADEFIFPKEGGSIPETIKTIMSLTAAAGGVAINWRMFGSSGQEKKDLTLGVLQRFKFRARDELDENKHVKTIVNPRLVKYIPIPHYAIYFTGIYAINEHGDFVPGPFNEVKTTDRICINHYFTKSREEWLEKRARGNADTGTIRPEGEFEIYDRNEVYDDGILKYLESRKASMAKSNCNQINLSLEIMCNVLKGKYDFFDGYNIEMCFCFWYLCKRFHTKYPMGNDESEINRFFLEILKERVYGKLHDWEIDMLRIYTPIFYNGEEAGSDLKKLQYVIDEALQVKRQSKDLLRDLNTVVVDIGNCGNGCDLDVKDMLADDNLFMLRFMIENSAGQWVNVKCVGETMKLHIACVGNGVMNICLKGIERKGEAGNRLPYWITVTSICSNGNNILQKPVDVWCDQPLICKKNVEDGETVNLEINWQPCIKSVKALWKLNAASGGGA